jgi:Cu-Zn family superoxide dismutase
VQDIIELPRISNDCKKERNMSKSKLLAVVTLVLAPWVLAVHAQQNKLEIRHYPLPTDVTYPEGMSYDPKSGIAYVGSVETNAIARVDVNHKESSVLSPPGALFPDMHGVRVDGAGRVWVAGGRSGHMAVLDPHTGKILKSFDTPADPPALINDMAIVGSNVYFTDTFRSILWRITANGNQFSEAEPWLQFKGTAVEYSEGANLNGIVASADGRYLIVDQTNKGLLFRIKIADKSIIPIDIGGEALTTCDGLALDARMLYVMRLGQHEIVTIELSRDLAKGHVVSRFHDPALKGPTAAAKVGDRLLVTNSQMNKRSTKSAEVPFEVVSIPLPMLSGK